MPSLYLIDGSAYIYRAFFALPPLVNSKGQQTNAVYGFTTMLLKVLREHQPHGLAVTFDEKGPTLRHEEYKEYKAHRPEMPQPMQEQIPYIHRVVEALGLPVVRCAGYEADDLIGTLARQAVAAGFEVVIVTGDKDMFQLLSPAVRIYDPVKDKWFGEEECRARFGVEPARVVDIMGLMGDATDNIPGVKGIGEKTALKLIQQFGTIENLLEHVGEVPAPQLRALLTEQAGNARLSRKLATIQVDCPVTFDPARYRVSAPPTEPLVALLRELEFPTLLKAVQPAESGQGMLGAGVETIRDQAGVRRFAHGAAQAEMVAIHCVLEGPAGEGRPTGAGGALLGMALSASNGMTVFAARPPSASGRSEWTRPLHPLLQPLADLLQSRTRVKAAHDLKPALLALDRAGLELHPPWFDTMIAAYLLNPNRRTHSLEAVALDALGYRLGAEAPRKEPEKPQALFEAAEGAEAERRMAEKAAEAASVVLRLVPILKERLEQQGSLRLFEDVEIPLVPVLAEIEQNGFLLNVASLHALSKELERELDRMMITISGLAGGEFNINSPKQLAAVLFDKLGLKPVRKTKTGYSTDEETLTQLATQHDLPAQILNYRSLSKLKSTYVDALPALVHPETGRLHTSLNQTVAATGRLSCLPAGTLVNTQEGLVGIERLTPGDFIRTPNGTRQVLAHESTGLKPVVSIHLSNGIVLRCSPDHKLRSKGEWKTASGLRVGDPVYMSFREGLFGHSLVLDIARTASFPTRKSPILPKEWSVELAELVGYSMADGHLARSNYNNKPAKLVLAFSWDEENLIQHFAAIIIQLFGKAPTRRITRTCPTLEVSGVDICGLFEQLGAGGSSKSIRVPPSLSAAPEVVVAGFLRGYFEGDGTATENLSVRSVSREMLEGVYHLLTLFGIPSAIREGSADPRGYAPRYTLFILGDRSKRMFRDRIHFLSTRKRVHLDTLISRQSAKSSAESFTIPDPGEILGMKQSLYHVYRTTYGVVPQRLFTFMHKFVAGRTSITLPCAEHLVESVQRGGGEAPAFLAESVDGQYFQVAVRAIEWGPSVQMYDLMVEGGCYLANGIIVHNSTDPNLQNIPVKGEFGLRIREAFVAAPGHVLLSADYSQIEPRILAHLSRDERLLRVFERGEDIHTATAVEIFNLAPDQITKEMRRVAKTVVFGILYGISPFGLSSTLGVSQQEAKKYIDAYFERYAGVKAFLDRTIEEATQRGYVTTILGRRRPIPELASPDQTQRSFGERMAVNSPIQGSAADLIKVAMIAVSKQLKAELPATKMILQVHDELIFETPEKELERAKTLVRSEMEATGTRIGLTVPLKVDLGVGRNWREAHP